jgi:hypothetical protein
MRSSHIQGLSRQTGKHSSPETLGSVEADHYFSQLLLPGNGKLLGCFSIALVESRLDSAQDVVQVFQVLRGQLVFCARGLGSLFHTEKDSPWIIRVATEITDPRRGGRASHRRCTGRGMHAPPDSDHSRVLTAFPTSRPRVTHFSRSSADGAHKAFTPLLTRAIPLSSRRFSMMPMDSPLQP